MIEPELDFSYLENNPYSNIGLEKHSFNSDYVFNPLQILKKIKCPMNVLQQMKRFQTQEYLCVTWFLKMLEMLYLSLFNRCYHANFIRFAC